jgi:hypothetical protein
MSELKNCPYFPGNRARFKSFKPPTDKNPNFTLYFISAFYLADSSGSSRFVSMEEALRDGLAALKVSIDPARFHLIKHFLNPDIDLSIGIAAMHYSVGANSGVSYKLMEIENFADLLAASNT